MTNPLEMNAIVADATRAATELTAISVSSKVTGTGALTAVLGWALTSTGIAVIGLVVTILGFAVSLHFQIRRDRREAAHHKAMLEGKIKLYITEREDTTCSIDERRE